MERIDRVDHKLQQAVPELRVGVGRAPVGLLASLSGPRATGAAADAAAAANPAAASGLPRRRDASARTRRTTHARLAIVDRVRMLLEHTHTHAISAVSGRSHDCRRAIVLTLVACYEMITTL